MKKVPRFIICQRCGREKQVASPSLQRVQKYCSSHCASACHRGPAPDIRRRGGLANGRRRQAVAKRQAEAWALDVFGSLTAREIAVFNFAAKLGYRRGYDYQRRQIRQRRDRVDAA